MKAADWACPHSKLILPADAPRDEWLDARKQGIGGSDVSAILGLTPWKSGYKVWLEKTGRLREEQEETPQMRWGKLHEPAMRKVFTEDTGIALRRTGLHVSRIYPHLMVTPDGLTADGGVFESKTANWRVFAEDWSDEDVADHAALQVSHSMGVTGRKLAHVMALTEGYKHRFYQVARDQEMIETVCTHLENWWEEYVIGDKEPPLTHVSLPEVKDHLSIAVQDQIVIPDPSKLWATIHEIEELKKQAKERTEKAEALEAALRLQAGEAGALVDTEDHPILTLRNDGTFSPTKFTKLLNAKQIDSLMKTVSVLDVDAVKEKFPKQYNSCRARVLRLKKEK